jgi:hypothetical protein
VQYTTATYTFDSINVGSIGVTPTSFIVFRFEPGQFNLVGAYLGTAAQMTPACVSGATLDVVGNYLVY